MSDFYLNLTKIYQPKKDIADYVESKGILVPKRFATLKEAKQFCKKPFLNRKIICRSEHPQEYSGVSGLLYSIVYRGLNKINSDEEIKNEILARSADSIYSFCKYTACDINQFKNDVSFSFWEYLGGLNFTLSADSAIKDRYHIITSLSIKKNELPQNYHVVYEKRNIIKEYNTPHRIKKHEISSKMDALIDLYEAVRNLDRFEKDQSPIIEAQLYKGKVYFLQYHRSRAFEPANFKLENYPKNDEIEIPFVRGATSENGIDCKMLSWYTGVINEYHIPQCIEGSFINLGAYSLILDEILVRKRQIQFLPFSHNSIFPTIHSYVSNFFKPKVFGCYMHKMQNEFNRYQDQYINVNLISDGYRAFLRYG